MSETVFEDTNGAGQLKLSPLKRLRAKRLGIVGFVVASFIVAPQILDSLDKYLKLFDNAVKFADQFVNTVDHAVNFIKKIKIRFNHPDAGTTVVVHTPSGTVAPQPEPSRPIEKPIRDTDKNRDGLMTEKPTSETGSPRDALFNARPNNRTIAARSGESVSLCGRYGTIVYGPDRTRANQMLLRQPIVLPSEGRDLDIAFDTITPITSNCRIKVLHSESDGTIYSFEEIVETR